ncbi:MAG: DNA starvation/stationary phase protection protein [Erysipelotrichaceae bacterium]|nr:DNA starvation/stationary phase protection protein [Erysipelotrichaceae bacterium]
MNKNTVNLVNEYIANIGVSYIKMHNLHWNVVGTQFKAVHEFLESIYDAYADVLDETAEILRMHDEMPAASLAQYLKLATIQELDSKEVSIKESIEITLADMELLKEQTLKIRESADKEDAFDLVAMMEDHISNYNKNIWFLKSMLK